MSMPGATLVDIWSISEAALWPREAVFLEVTWDFLAGVTEKSFESGGIILTDRATRSLLLQFINKKLEKFEFSGCGPHARLFALAKGTYRSVRTAYLVWSGS